MEEKIKYLSRKIKSKIKVTMIHGQIRIKLFQFHLSQEKFWQIICWG